MKQLKAQQSKDIHYMWKQTITVLIITVLACKCIQSFVERRLQDDQRPFIRVHTHIKAHPFKKLCHH